jgi:hypothetical protein
MKTEQEIQAAVMSNGEMLSKLTPDEVLAKMDFTEEEREFIKDNMENPDKYRDFLLNPTLDPAMFKKLIDIHDKYETEIMKLLLGAELFKELQEEECNCGGCDGCGPGLFANDDEDEQ